MRPLVPLELPTQAPGPTSPPLVPIWGWGRKEPGIEPFVDRPFLGAGEFIFVSVFPSVLIVVRICVTSISITFVMASVVCYVWIDLVKVCIRNCYLQVLDSKRLKQVRLLSLSDPSGVGCSQRSPYESFWTRNQTFANITVANLFRPQSNIRALPTPLGA